MFRLLICVTWSTATPTADVRHVAKPEMCGDLTLTTWPDEVIDRERSSMIMTMTSTPLYRCIRRYTPSLNAAVARTRGQRHLTTLFSSSKTVTACFVRITPTSMSSRLWLSCDYVCLSLCIFTAQRVRIARTMPWQDVRPSVCLSVRLSVRHKTVSCGHRWTYPHFFIIR